MPFTRGTEWFVCNFIPKLSSFYEPTYYDWYVKWSSSWWSSPWSFDLQLPLGVALFRYLMVCHPVFCLNKVNLSNKKTKRWKDENRNTKNSLRNVTQFSTSTRSLVQSFARFGNYLIMARHTSKIFLHQGGEKSIITMSLASVILIR